MTNVRFKTILSQRELTGFVTVDNAMSTLTQENGSLVLSNSLVFDVDRPVFILESFGGGVVDPLSWPCSYY